MWFTEWNSSSSNCPVDVRILERQAFCWASPWARILTRSGRLWKNGELAKCPYS